MAHAAVASHKGTRNSAFGGLVAASLGLMLLETGCILLETRAAVHLLNVSIGGLLVLLMLRRFLRHWPSRVQALSPPGKDRGRQLPGIVCMTATTTVGAAAYLGASALAHGFVSPLILFAAGLVFAPWTLVSSTRAHCLANWAVAVLGIGAALFAGRSWLNPLFLFLATWFLWMCALAAWTLSVLDEKRQQRRGTPAGSGEPQAANAAR